MLAGQPFVQLLTDQLTQMPAGKRLALVVVVVVGVQGPEMHQLQGQLIVVLQRVDQRGRIDAEGMHLAQHHAQELGVAGDQRVVIGRPGDEVIGQVGAAVGHGGDIVDGQVQLLEAEATGLADRAGEQLVAGYRKRMAFGPGSALGAPLDTEKAVGVQAQHARPSHVDGMQGIADDQLLSGERRIEPIQRRLTFLEVMQVDPASDLAVDPGDFPGDAPVGVLDAGLEEDHPLQLTYDVVLFMQTVHYRRLKVDRIALRRHIGQQFPVLFADLDHVVEPRVVAIGHFRKAEVRALAGVRRDDIVDDDGVMRGSDTAELQHLLFGAQLRVDIKADAVEVAIDGRRVLASAQATRALHRAVVDTLHPEFGQRAPQPIISQRFEHRATLGSDDRRRVRGEPYRAYGAGITRAGLGVGPLPESRLAGV